MAKIKTLEQKIKTDLRRKSNYEIILQNLETPQVKINEQPSTYAYLLKDLTRTIVVTGVIIGVQIILFLLLKKHLIALPGIFY